jgi:3-methyladenine DNA glycosylase AlkD
MNDSKSRDTTAMVRFVRRRFRELANPADAGPMQAYMKTEMPFYGIKKPARVVVYRELRDRFVIDSAKQYAHAIEAFWSLPHREERYTALHIAMQHEQFIAMARLPLYKRLIVEGAWWDLVDDVAIRLTGRLWSDHRARVSGIMDRWIDDGNMWLRRAAIIGQVKHRERTDEDRLFSYCARRAEEREFFIRKAIGWALREHARIQPGAVRRFVKRHRGRLSPLSLREAMKHIA